MLVNDQAICIRAVDYSETSQIVTFFARRSGKLSCIAKGSKRQKSSFGGPIEILSFGNIVFSDSSHEKLAALTEFEPLSGINSSAITSDINIFNCCLFAAEITNLLVTDYDPHPGLFDNLFNFIHQASQLKNSTDINKKIISNLIIFELMLLTEIGLHPVFEFCVNCRSKFDPKWPEIYFSNNAKGLICKDCQGIFFDKILLSADIVKCLTNFKSLDSNSETVLKQTHKILIGYFTDILGKPPKMARYILNF